MNRRQFSMFALGGLGLAAMPRSLASATVSNFSPLPPVPAQPLRPLSSTELLIERAKNSLDEHQAQFALRDRIAVADFSVASRELRFHLVDLISGQRNSYLVAHGKGSDPEHSGWLHRFSNVPDSEASSEGAYRTGQMYVGQHGQSMRLIGLDPTNNMAEDRAIVVHAAPYVTEDHIAQWGKVGRSQGCFALAPHMLSQVLGMLGQGRMLYAGRAA